MTGFLCGTAFSWLTALKLNIGSLMSHNSSIHHRQLDSSNLGCWVMWRKNLDLMILCGLCIFIITGLPSQKNPFKNMWHIPTSDFSFCSLIWEWTFDQIFIIFLDPRRIAGWELNYFHFYIADKAYVNWLSFWSISGHHLMVSFVSKQFLHACLCEAYSHLWAAVWRVHCRISGRDDGPLIRSCQRPGYSYRCDCVRRLLSAKKKQREND